MYVLVKINGENILVQVRYIDPILAQQGFLKN